MEEKNNTTHSPIDRAIVSSSSHVASSNVVPEILSGSCLASNPFAIKTVVLPSSSTSATDEKSKPLIAPSTLKLDNSDSQSSQSWISSMSSKVVLRPSRLAAQTEKLDLKSSPEKDAKKDENSVNESTESKDPDSTNNSDENKGNVLRPQMFLTGISTSTSNVSSSSKDSKAIESTSFISGNKENSHVSGGFVFGQNLHERALNYNDNDLQSTSSPINPQDLTFKDAALKKEEPEEVQETQDEKLKKSLSESAKEYESKQSKRKFDEISVITGEEEESNVLQINCKLFAFDKSKLSWHERGRGILRLNDRKCDGTLQSRVVMRTHGNLRVVLNTKVWAGMAIEHPSEKTVRLTAIDSEGIAVYLVMARPKDADQLFSALDWRVGALKTGDGCAVGKDDSMYEKAATSSMAVAVTVNDSFNGSPMKRCRTDDLDDSDYATEFVSGGNDISSDSTNTR